VETAERNRSMWKLGTYLLLLVVAIVYPLVASNSYYVHVIVMSFIFAIAVYGFNLIVGYLGQLSLAQAGFFGIGAYMSGLFTMKLHMSFWLSLPLTAFLTMLISLPIGFISFRTKGNYFAIFTMCVGIIINLVIEKWDSVTGGNTGLIGIPQPNNLGPISFDSVISQYYLVLAFLVITIFVMTRLVNSLVGRTFMSIRNSSDLAATLGINVMANKILAFAIASFFTAIAGVLYAHYIRFIGPDASGLNMTFDFLLSLLIGGQASIAGPLVGSLLSTGLTEGLQSLQEYRMVVFGILLILIVKFFPMGIVGGLQLLRFKLMKRFAKTDVAGIAQMKPSKGESHAAENKSIN